MPRARHVRSAFHCALAPLDRSLAPSASELLRIGLLGGVRSIHGGHVSKTLEKMHLPRHTWLKEVDQAPDASGVRKQKDRYLRELGLAHGQIQGLFNDDKEAQKSILPSTAEEKAKSATSAQQREDVTEAMRVYRLLRPDAPPFYEEDAMLGMKAKMNKLMSEDEQARDMGSLGSDVTKYAGGDPFQAYLPVVNPRAFLIALESVTASLADDLETILHIMGFAENLPSTDDPLRFKKLVDMLFSAFPLKRDPSYVSQFMDEYWPTLRLLLPESIANLKQSVVEEWLRGHLHRIRLNKRRADPKIFQHKAPGFMDEEYYNLAEDFIYDDEPMPAELADERNLDFPLENAKEYMDCFLSFLREGATWSQGSQAVGGDLAAANESEDGVETVSDQFQQLVWDLEKIGLRNWLKMDIQDLERFLPKAGHQMEPLRVDNKDDCEVAWLMLRCAARGRANLLDFEKVDPYKLLHGMPARAIDEELAELPPNDFLNDQDLGELVEDYVTRTKSHGSHVPVTEEAWNGGADVRDIFKRELDFYRTAGPAEWFPTENKDGFTWKWRQPPNTFWDERRKVYIPQQRGVDPNLDLKEMRQHLLEMRRMGSMNKDGRLYYYRAIVVVGNGRGVYGFGIGFANAPKEARTDAALKALQNLDFIDTDPGKMLCFPVRGQEYKHQFDIIPRPIGRGIKANKKFLPLLYILGLDNCKVRFKTSTPWFTRVRAIKRALDQVMSRRTQANMTGKRHALLVAPGDHWVHWPDRWFSNIRKTYDDREKHTRLVRRHILLYKKRGNRMVTPKEVKPGWSRKNWARWNNPLEHWIQQRRANGPYDPAKGGASGDAIPGPTAEPGSQSPAPGDAVVSKPTADTTLASDLRG